jgi:hypothetical protein
VDCATWPEVKIYLQYLRFISDKIFQHYILLKILLNAVLGDILIKKSELPPACDGIFVYFGRLGVIYDFQLTNKNAEGEGGLSQGVLLASYWLPVSHI